MGYSYYDIWIMSAGVVFIGFVWIVCVGIKNSCQTSSTPSQAAPQRNTPTDVSTTVNITNAYYNRSPPSYDDPSAGPQPLAPPHVWTTAKGTSINIEEDPPSYETVMAEMGGYMTTTPTRGYGGGMTSRITAATTTNTASRYSY